MSDINRLSELLAEARLLQKKADERKSSVFALLFFVLSAIPMVALFAFVLKLMYQWFFIPVFHTQYISTSQFMGLSLMRTLIFTKIKDENPEKSIYETTALSAFITLIIWGAGAVIHYWVM